MTLRHNFSKFYPMSIWEFQLLRLPRSNDENVWWISPSDRWSAGAFPADAGSTHPRIRATAMICDGRPERVKIGKTCRPDTEQADIQNWPQPSPVLNTEYGGGNEFFSCVDCCFLLGCRSIVYFNFSKSFDAHENILTLTLFCSKEKKKDFFLCIIYYCK